jgi:hypothetical protein
LYFLNTPPQFKYATEHRLFEAYHYECDFYDNRGQAVKDKIEASCYIPKTDRSLFIWGDSHAQQLYYGLNQLLPKEISILQVATSSCPPSLTPQQPDPLLACNKSNRFALKVIAEEKPQTVLLAQKDMHEGTDFDQLAKTLKGMGVHTVVLVGPVPQWNTALYKIIAAKFWSSTPQRSASYLLPEIFASDRVLKQRYSDDPNLRYVSLTDFFCDPSGCLLYLDGDRRDGIVTHDYGHLLPRASVFLSERLLAPLIIDTFTKLSAESNVSAEVPKGL